MKKLSSLWLVILMLAVSIPSMGAMSISKMRENARFLTDRMAYELHLSQMQYDDVYEVNYDFINSVRYIMDDVVRGYGYAVDRYYDYLDYRNEDLRWILSSSQYRRFMGVEYFYRPIYTTPNQWLFRIYNVYHDVKHFYFGKPHHYKTYNGAHSRHHHHAGYYKSNHQTRYRHEFYKGDVKVRHEKPALRVQDKRKPSNAGIRKPNEKRGLSVSSGSHSGSRPSLGKQNSGRVNQSVSSGKSKKEVKPAVKGEKRNETQKRSDKSRGSDNRREEGRKASRGR
jgi:hypothetical protein